MQGRRTSSLSGFRSRAAAVRRRHDPKTKQFTLIDTCYSTHHLQFDNDADETVFQRARRAIFGWIDTKVWRADEGRAEGERWCGQVLDTNGDGKITRPWNVSRVGNSALYLGDTAAGGPGGRGADAAFNPALDTMVTRTCTLSFRAPWTTWCGA